MGADGKLSKGQMFSIPPTEAWNNAMDAGAAYAEGRLIGPLPRRLKNLPPGVAAVKNGTGGGLDLGDVICLDSFALTELDNAPLWFTGAQPTTAEKPYGVLLEPIPDDEYGLVMIHGVCLAKIDRIYASHPFAHIKSGDNQLQSDWHGQAEILHMQEYPAASGNYMAVVRLGNYQSVILEAKTDGAITAGGSGTVSIWQNGADTGENETAHFVWMDSGSITTGKEILIRYSRDRGKWVIINAECPAA